HITRSSHSSSGRAWGFHRLWCSACLAIGRSSSRISAQRKAGVAGRSSRRKPLYPFYKPGRIAIVGRNILKVLIMADMEGVSGIVVWEQVNGGAPMYEEGRKLYTEEINAAVRGAKAAGATEIVAVDCHGAGSGWTFNSFIPELLHPDCEWVAHHTWSRYT